MTGCGWGNSSGKLSVGHLGPETLRLPDGGPGLVRRCGVLPARRALASGTRDPGRGLELSRAIPLGERRVRRPFFAPQGARVAVQKPLRWPRVTARPRCHLAWAATCHIPAILFRVLLLGVLVSGLISRF